ncbi:MAG: pseudouridine synthase, partial [bacterium]
MVGEAGRRHQRGEGRPAERQRRTGGPARRGAPGGRGSAAERPRGRPLGQQAQAERGGQRDEEPVV